MSAPPIRTVSYSAHDLSVKGPIPDLDALQHADVRGWQDFASIHAIRLSECLLP